MRKMKTFPIIEIHGLSDSQNKHKPYYLSTVKDLTFEQKKKKVTIQTHFFFPAMTK